MENDAWGQGDPNPSGKCMCGCGRTTPIAVKTSRRDQTTKGKHRRYVVGHSGPPRKRNVTYDINADRRNGLPEYTVEDRGYSTPCWLWKYSTTSRGYGQRWNFAAQKNQLAHRWYYEQAKGTVPEGMQLDHKCRVKGCVNPDHMEAVTPSVNIRRACDSRDRHVKSLEHTVAVLYVALATLTHPSAWR